jgi:hypothetical protein
MNFKLLIFSSFLFIVDGFMLKFNSPFNNNIKPFNKLLLNANGGGGNNIIYSAGGNNNDDDNDDLIYFISLILLNLYTYKNNNLYDLIFNKKMIK